MSKRLGQSGVIAVVAAALFAAALLAVSANVALAGQGGTAPAESNMTPLVIVVLAAVVAVAGVGLLISRRKS